MAKPRIPKGVKSAIQSLIAYNWADEQEDYRENCSEASLSSKQDHIFTHIVAVNNWLNDEQKTADEEILPF